MKVVCVGGGPAGLYLAILLRRFRPDIEIQVLERNQLGDAYGFGVVFSDETLTRLEQADPESYDQISRSFRRWGDIEVRLPDGESIVSGGHGFAAISRRRLLEILDKRALDLGALIEHGVEITDRRQLPEAGLVVGADGLSSRVRRWIEPNVRPSITTHRNKYVWFGTPKVFDRFTFIFLETPAGRVWAHIYPYDEQTSTFIVETSPETWRDLGFTSVDLPPGASDLRSLQACADLFADHLDGAGLLGNNSKWLEFSTLKCERWSGEGMVLLGDAAHTAHFSVGSGTKLAMEDSVALAESLARHDRVDEALVEYERERRPEVASLQRAASASRQWFEGVDRYSKLDPRQFAFSLLTRSQRITYDNLRQRDPVFMERMDRWYAGDTVAPSVPPMFHPFTVGGLTLRNRIVVSPMAQYSAIEGVPNDWHLVHLGSRAVGGAGLVLTEMTCVSPEGRISYGCTGLWNEEQMEAWKRIVDFAHEHTTTAIGLQLGHSGRKGSTKRMWEGDTDPLEEGNWPLLAPSPISYRPDSQVPKEMTRQDMDEVREQHVRSALLGAEAGFDWLELHFAHGYLMSSFLSPLSNARAD
ncbi:MAG TPA: FAD-dependent monooxygenase, partial [Acidimicrobiia bacterium]